MSLLAESLQGYSNLFNRPFWKENEGKVIRSLLQSVVDNVPFYLMQQSLACIVKGQKYGKTQAAVMELSLPSVIKSSLISVIVEVS